MANDTAKFGAEVTDPGPTRNNVTPRQGVVDRSAATFVSTLGNAAIQGTEVYATKATEEFAEDYRRITEIALGQDDPRTDEEKAFVGEMKKTDQALRLGNVTVAKLYREKVLREKVAEYPWLARRFEEAARRVDGRYQEVISAQEELARRQAEMDAAALKRHDKLVTNARERIEANMAKFPGITMNFRGEITPVELLTDEELFANAQLFDEKNVLYQWELYDRAQRGEARAERSAQIADAAEGRAIDKHRILMQEAENRELASQYVFHSIKAIGPVLKGIDEQVLDPAVRQQEKMKVFAAAKTELASLMRNGGYSGLGQFDTATLNAGLQLFDNAIEGQNALLSGDASELAFRRTKLASLEVRYQLSELEAGNIYQLMRLNGMDPTWIALESTVGGLKTKEGTAALDKAARRMIGDFKNYVDGKFEFSTMDAPSRETIQTIAARTLVGYAEADSEILKSVSTRPENVTQFIEPSVIAFKETTDSAARSKVYAALTNRNLYRNVAKSNTTTYNKVKAVMPELFQQRMVDLNGKVSEFKDMVVIEDDQTSGTQTFVPDPSASDQEKARKIADSLNGLVRDASDFASATNELDSGTLFVARYYLGLDNEVKDYEAEQVEQEQ